jgi:hypothetical protein
VVTGRGSERAGVAAARTASNAVASALALDEQHISAVPTFVAPTEQEARP